MNHLQKLITAISLATIPLSAFATQVPVDDFVAVSAYLVIVTVMT